MQDLRQAERTLANQIEVINDGLANSAGREEMAKIEEVLQSFAKKESIEELNRKLYGFYPVNDAISERELVKEKLEKLEEAVNARAMKK